MKNYNYNLVNDLFLKEVIKNLGEDLLSIVAVGSWVTKAIQPGLSDLDFLIITKTFRSDNLVGVGKAKKMAEEGSNVGIGVDLVALADLKQPKKLPGKAVLSLVSVEDGYSRVVYGSLPKFDLKDYLFSEEFFFFNFKLMCYLESKSITYLKFSNTEELRRAAVKKLKSCITLLRLIKLYENKEKEFNNDKLLRKYLDRFSKCGIKRIYEFSSHREKFLEFRKSQIMEALLVCQDFINKLSTLILRA